ncbi:hypothetical protein [Acinetobacter sp. NyZ410]|uniref:hypothetical protein n=1 Tax=Acinetobacter sp. NyZ410 TaxID=2929509 RepID=UPI001FB8C9B9|nr:hypothetical protein [Acinetobacter sp. NyZ410]UOH17208.1 hypothetical protein MTO68_15435 [Acinetobacter sp. NyZ410]
MSKPVLFSIHDFRFNAKRFNRDLEEPVQPIDIIEVFKEIAKLNYSEYNYPLSEDTLISRIKLIEINEAKKYISLLVIISDKNARNRSYTDNSTGKTRLTNKTKNEGDDSRVHIVIHTNNDKFSGKLAIERERGSRVNPNLLRVLIDRSMEFIYENHKTQPDVLKLFSEDHPSGFKDENGAFQRLPKKIKATIDNVFSDAVLNAFKLGKIEDLELIHTHQVTKTDQHSSFHSTSSSFHFEVDPQVIPNEVTSPEEIQTTLVTKLTHLWESTFSKSTPIPLSEHKYRIKYKDDFGEVVTHTYTPAETLDFTLAKTIKIDHRTFTPIDWKETPEINSTLCLQIFLKLKALQDEKYE